MDRCLDLSVGTQKWVASLSMRPDCHPYTNLVPVLIGETEDLMGFSKYKSLGQKSIL